jgi:hypothetical protein
MFLRRQRTRWRRAVFLQRLNGWSLLAVAQVAAGKRQAVAQAAIAQAYQAKHQAVVRRQKPLLASRAV